MKRLLPVLLLAALAVAWLLYRQHDSGAVYYTGFVEGEEVVIRSEVAGRVLEVAFREGEPVAPGAVLVRLSQSGIDASVASALQKIEVLERQIVQAGHEVEGREGTWTQDRSARQSDLAAARSQLELAERSARREEGLGRSGATTNQQLDDARTRADGARSAFERATAMLERSDAEAHLVAAAKAELEVLRGQKTLAENQLAELEVVRAKSTIHAPEVATVVQSQLIWPGELAQPGTALLSLLDPRDKYVQIYVGVADLARVTVGARVEIELDSAPGRRVPGEISFIADHANFTPEKIETRSDRIGQVYRVKVRILEDVESFQPGTEGNVYLTGDAATARRAAGNGGPEKTP